MSNILFAVIILFFLLMTLREWLMILQNHPGFVLAVIVLAVTYGVNTSGIIDKITKGTLVVAVTIFLTLCVEAYKEYREEELED